MSNNRLSSVPQDIGSLSGLEELFLQYNHLTLLPVSQKCALLHSLIESFLCTALSVMYIVFTIFFKIPSKHTCFYRCKSFHSLPLSLTIQSSICNLSHLCELDVKNNNLASLPNDIGSLSSLIILCATNNHITVLPSSIGKLSKLQELTLQ